MPLINACENRLVKNNVFGLSESSIAQDMHNGLRDLYSVIKEQDAK
ncbi:MAG: hypothetical protein JZU64_11310 [Rhodoferax sp.]|nr:hypothetical protein [Rhodoferax sp.]